MTTWADLERAASKANDMRAEMGLPPWTEFVAIVSPAEHAALKAEVGPAHIQAKRAPCPCHAHRRILVPGAPDRVRCANCGEPRWRSLRYDQVSPMGTEWVP